MESIEEGAIETFKLAAKTISYRWQNELFSERREIEFCATNLAETLIVILNGDWGRIKFSASLQKALEILDAWATIHASQDQKNFWADISKPHVQTCFKTFLIGNTEVLETEIELQERDSKLAKHLLILKVE